MTHEECFQELSRIEREYKDAATKLKSNYEINKQKTLNTWANTNNRYKVGDIIEANGVIIKIDKIRGYKGYYAEKMSVSYSGHVLTKKLQPRKDEWVTSIYDDGREIKLLKSADNI